MQCPLNILDIYYPIFNIYYMTKEELIYELIFSENNEFSVEVCKYIEDIYKYEDFTDEIKKILVKSKVLLVSENINITSKGNIIWEIKIKK